MKIAVAGEVLWDLVAGREFLGGAPFNFAVNAKRLGHEVLFVSGVGEDCRGEKILREMGRLGLSTEYVTKVPEQPTGTVSATVDPSGQPAYVIHRPAAYDFPKLTASQLQALADDPPDWVAYGTLQQLSSAAHEVLLSLLKALPKARRFYDVNLRHDCYNGALVRNLLERASVLKLNQDEAYEVGSMLGIATGSLETFCRECRGRFDLAAVCVTRAAAGCVLLTDEFIEAPGYAIPVADTIGAGDAFSAALVHGLNAGCPAAQVADFANRLGAVVASHAGAIVEWSQAELEDLQRSSAKH
ncbi:MAG TPA: carbohydrate kinase [Candidatus Angelobacter sp.]|nr:carbohydrate kinase [Candidatus Angelobacter sp.]